MRVKIAAASVAAFFLLFAGAFLWLGLTGRSGTGAPVAGEGPQVVLSEMLPDGLIEADVYLGSALSYRIDMRFTPEAGSAIAQDAPPTLVLAMDGMGDGEVEPRLEILGPGRWRGTGSLPMAGRWTVIAGYGDDLGEVTVDVR